MESKLLSVIVPVYNAERYLVRCVDSILAQTFTDFELILVDDGSSDGSGALCDEYARHDARVRVIHQANAGPGAARNAGLDAARGEWIGFVDSDDWIDDNHFESLLLAAQENAADISACGVIDEGKHRSYSWNRHDIRDCKKTISDLLLNRVHGALYCYLIRHELFSKNKIRFPEGINICEDVIVLLLLLVASPKTAYVDIYSYHYFVENYSSITKSRFSYEKCVQLVASVGEMERILQENSLYDRYIPEIQAKRRYCKCRILESSPHSVYKEFFDLYPGIYKTIKGKSPSLVFQKALLFSAEKHNTVFVAVLLGFFHLFWRLNNMLLGKR